MAGPGRFDIGNGFFYLFTAFVVLTLWLVVSLVV